MAIYILITKHKEDDNFCLYQFGKNERDTGMLSIDKKTGRLEIVNPLPGDDGGRYAERAKRKVFLHWRDGEFPERTCWAS